MASVCPVSILTMGVVCKQFIFMILQWLYFSIEYKINIAYNTIHSYKDVFSKIGPFWLGIYSNLWIKNSKICVR